ncbi:hypothetical protein Tco_0647209, partial [Tanacetum coccineum]
LLLIAQQKINNLDGDVIVEFVTSLKMFTRSIVIQNRVEDVQLGIEDGQCSCSLPNRRSTILMVM